MKSLLLVSALFSGFTEALTAQETINLTITVTGVPSTSGVLEVGLLENEKQFLGESVEYKVIRVPATAGENKIILSNIPVGQYVVYSYHDANNNRELDENWRGAPEEAFGFSGTKKQILREPLFSELLVNVNSTITDVLINLIQAR